MIGTAARCGRFSVRHEDHATCANGLPVRGPRLYLAPNEIALIANSVGGKPCRRKIQPRMHRASDKPAAYCFVRDWARPPKRHVASAFNCVHPRLKFLAFLGQHVIRSAKFDRPALDPTPPTRNESSYKSEQNRAATRRTRLMWDWINHPPECMSGAVVVGTIIVAGIAGAAAAREGFGSPPAYRDA